MKPGKIIALVFMLVPQCSWSQLIKYQHSFLQPNGMVYAVEGDSATNKVYVGGEFDFFYELRTKMFAVDTGSRLVDRNFPDTEGNVNVIISDGNDGVFVGGQFKKLGNVACINLAHVAKDGTVSPLSGINMMASGDKVSGLTRIGDKLYVSGVLTQLNGMSISNSFFYDLTSNQISTDPFPVSKVIIQIKIVEDSLAYLVLPDSIILVNTNTLQRVSSFTPLGTNFGIVDIEIIGDTLFLGGTFTTVNGQGRSKIAAINRLNGNLLSWDPSANGTVKDIDQHNGMLLVAGSFSYVGGQSKDGFAALSLSTGGAYQISLDHMDIYFEQIVLHDGRMFILGSDIAGTVIREKFRVVSLDTWEEDYWPFHCIASIEQFMVQKGRLYAIGSMMEVGSVEAKNLAEFDLQTGYPSPVVKSIDRRVISLHVRNGILYCGGIFGMFGDSARQGAAAIHLATKQVTAWNPLTSTSSAYAGANVIKSFNNYLILGGNFTAVRDSLTHKTFALVDTIKGNSVKNFVTAGTVYSIFIQDTMIYVGGNFIQFLNQSRIGIVQLGFNSLDLTNWQPNTNGPVMSIFADANHVYVGGKFTTIAGFSRSNIAQLNPLTGSVTSWTLSLPDTVYKIRGVNDSVISMAGAFRASSSNSWIWVLKATPTYTYKHFNAQYSVFGDVSFKNYTIGYGCFTDLRYTGSDNSLKRRLAFFKTCTMPDKPYIVGDTVGCANRDILFSVGNSQLNDAENWSWDDYSTCNANGKLGSNYILNKGSGSSISVRPIGECSTPDYCTSKYISIRLNSSSKHSIKHCSNEYPFVMNGKSYFGPGIYYDTLVNKNDCDSIMEITLLSWPTDSVALTVDGCDSAWIGGQWRTVPGLYPDTLANKYSCDSILYIDLKLNTSILTSFQATACDSFRFGGVKLTGSGTYYDTLSRASGCDSILELQLTIHPSYLTKSNITGCNEYEFYGQTLTQPGTYRKEFTTSMGCDSIFELTLSIVNNSAGIVYNSGTLTAYPSGANKYEWLNCNTNYTSIFSSQTSATYTPSSNGSYAVAVTKQGCIDTSTCYVLNNVGIESYSPDLIKLYPNPSEQINGGFWLQDDSRSVKELIIFDILGKEINHEHIDSDLSFVSMAGAQPGTYLVYLVSANGQVALERLVILP